MKHGQEPAKLRKIHHSAQNFGLTRAEFSELSEALADGDLRLFERAFLGHFEECRKYLEDQDGAAEGDAHDATMNAFLQFRELVVRSKVQYGNLRYLVTRMARQHYWRTSKRQRGMAMISTQELNIRVEEPLYTAEDAEVLRRAFRCLPPACYRLLKSHYYGQKSLHQIAEENGRNPAAVRKQKSRCVQLLKTLYNSCL